MRVLIRADATQESGSGHVMRCAALAQRLRRAGAQADFVCAPLPGRLHDWLLRQSYGVHLLDPLDSGAPEGWRKDAQQTAQLARALGAVDLLVVDHYGLDRRWETAMRPLVRRILAIDDLADRDHDCDIVLDQNLHRDAPVRYLNRVPVSTRRFVGPGYALLREEFDDPALLRARNGALRQLLVFFGGTDPGNQSLKLVEALRGMGTLAPQTTLVLGPAHGHPAVVRALASGLTGLTVLDATDNMSAHMAQADLAIGTCGVAAWERCALGLPSLIVVTAENQREDAQMLHAMGAVRNLGDAADVQVSDWIDALQSLRTAPHRLQAMSVAAAQVMHGRSAALAEFENTLLNG